MEYTRAAPRACSFAEAARYRMPAAEKAKLHALEAKIPADTQGLYELLYAPDANQSPTLIALRLAPDRATEVMAGFKQRLGMSGRHFTHGTHSTYVLEGAALDAVIGDPQSHVPAAHAAKFASRGLQARLLRHHSGIGEYDDTYPLKELKTHASLSHAEQQAVEKILGNIPSNLQGLFYGTVERHQSGVRITAIGIDPLLSIELLNDGLLKKLPGTPLSNPTRIALGRGEDPKEIRHPDARSLVMGDGVAERLAAALPAPSVYREY